VPVSGAETVDRRIATQSAILDQTQDSGWTETDSSKLLLSH